MFRSDPDRPKRRGLQRGLGRLTATIGVFALVIGFLTVGATTTDDAAVAATGSDFNPGNIISDALFYKSGTMDKNEIQSFLNSKVASCRSGYTCLKSYSQATGSQSAKREGCAAYAGSKKESAASIIAKVSTACGINPQVLLVLLEKETGLISAKAPTSGTYRKATGYGCPDTSVCDSTYYGFFNQVYNAAFQFKKYQASPNSRGYVAGRWNTIQYHPNQSCGTSNVYIENQATAALYIYTPYRPNQASLNNMGRTGDGCSSYGNRNFWAFFTDWFGDTKGGSSFVRDAGTGAIYLIAGTVKHYVASIGTYTALAKLGTYRNVSPAYLSGYTAGTNASALVRNPLTGDIALVQGNTRHRMGSCSQVSVWGYDCGSAMNLMPGQWSTLPQGGEVSNFMVVAGSKTTYFLNDSTRFPIAEWEGVLRINEGNSPWVGTMPATNAQRFPIGRQLETPGRAIKTAASNDVYLVDGLSTKIRVPSMGVLSEYGIRSVKTVSQTVLDGYRRSGADLTLLADCRGSLVLVHGGATSRLTTNHGSGISTTPLSNYTCAGFRSASSISSRIFVKSASSAEVLVLFNGTARPVLSWNDAVALNGGTSPVVVTMSAAALQGFAKPGGIVAPASLIKSPGSANVYFVDGPDRAVKLDSFGTSDALGIRSWRTVPDSVLAGYAKSGASMSRVVICSGAAHMALNGTLYRLTATSGHGLPVTDVRGSSCSALKISTNAPVDKVFIKGQNSSAVYYLTGGKRRAVASWSDLVGLNGGATPHIVTVAASEISSLPDGGPITK